MGLLEEKIEKRGISAMRILSWLIMLCGTAYFVWAAWCVAYDASMDYGVVVDMARNMASGLDFPTFFYGQAYMGTLEPAVSAVLCALFEPTPFWVCMGTTLFSIATLFIIMGIARKLGGDAAACLALIFAIFGGCHWIYFSVSPRGGYSLAALLCLLAVWFGSLCDFKNSTGHIRIPPSLLLGFSSGLAFWNLWIALPAFAAAGIMLIIRLKREFFSKRFLVSASTGFFIGSAPWWIWTFRNGLGALDMGNGPFPPPGLRAPFDIVNVVCVRFFGVTNEASAFWHSLFPWILIAMLFFVVADAILCSCDARRRFTLAVGVYATLFLAAYSLTSFGAWGTARYFVHLVPSFSIISGAALGAAIHKAIAKPRPKIQIQLAASSAILIIISYCLFFAPRSIHATNSHLRRTRAGGVSWAAAVNEAANDPSLAQPAFAEFAYFGANWASNRRLCFVSPRRWRYSPYLLKLESAESPTIVNDSQWFLAFCNSTQGRCRIRRVANYIVADMISPPPEMHELPIEFINAISTAAMPDARSLLLDDNLATVADISPKTPSIDISIEGGKLVAGVSAIIPYAARLHGWVAEVLDSDGNPTEKLAECQELRGWFWSGSRPYMFGPDLRLELRWDPRPLSRIRITFKGVDSPDPANGFRAVVSDMRILAASPLPPMDSSAVANVVASLKQDNPGARIHAERWLRNKLGIELDPSISLGSNGCSLAVRDVCDFATIDMEHGAIVVLRGDAADSAARTLDSLKMTFTRMEAGGCSIFRISPYSKDSSSADTIPKLRFFGKRLLLDMLPNCEIASSHAGSTAIFGGEWRISCISQIPERARRGTILHFDFMIESIGQHKRNKTFALFIHGLRNKKIACVSGINTDGELATIPADAPRPIKVSVEFPIPSAVPPGLLEIAIGAKYPGATLRMVPRGEGIKTDKFRLLLGSTEVL